MGGTLCDLLKPSFLFLKIVIKRLISLRDLPFLLVECVSVFLPSVFHFVHVSCPKIARNEYPLHHNSSNFVISAYSTC